MTEGAASNSDDRYADLAAKYESLADNYGHLKQTYDKLLFEYERMRRRLVGPKRERTPDSEDQLVLPDVLEMLEMLGFAPDTGLEEGDEGSDDELEAAKRDARDADKKKSKKKPRRRKPEVDLADLPVERVVLEPVERLAPGGDALKLVEEVVSEHVERKAATLVRVQVVRPKYERRGPALIEGDASPNEQADGGGGGDDAADEERSSPEEAASLGAPLGRAPRPDERRFIIAPMPSRPIDKGMAGPGLLAYTLVSKYLDHLPWYRLTSILERDGFRVARSTLSDWVEGSVGLLSYITRAMWEDARKNATYTIVDATGVLVQAKKRCRWRTFYVAVVPGEHVLFRYLRKNDGDSVAKLFAGFSGYVHADASSVYHELYRISEDIIEAGCWSHARRKFFEAYSRDRERALVGIGYIGRLYEAHRASLDKKGEVDVEKRRRLARPILLQFLRWVRAQLKLVDEGTPIHAALGYVSRQRAPLLRFLKDGRLRLDTNIAEGELRREAKGRDNWLFCASDDGATWNTVVVSLVASCQMHDIEPWAYLRDVLTLLPEWDQTRALELAPKHWKATRARPETRAKLRRLRLVDWGDDADPRSFMHEYGHNVADTYGGYSELCIAGWSEGWPLGETVADAYAAVFVVDDPQTKPLYRAGMGLSNLAGAFETDHHDAGSIELHPASVDCIAENYHHVGNALEQAIWELLFNKNCASTSCNRDDRAYVGNTVWSGYGEEQVIEAVGKALGWADSVLGPDVTYQQFVAQFLLKVQLDAGLTVFNNADSVFAHHDL